MTAAVAGPDGLARCPWALSAPDYLDYHDGEWGRPVRGDAALYERLSLEGFQAGLSWLTILRKRPAFQTAFAGFEPAAVATFGDADVERLLTDPGIVRNRAKIMATIANAGATLALGKGGLSRLVWSHAPDGSRQPPTTLADVPARTLESTSLAKALRNSGFRFMGPTTAYALMQACGVVNDHLQGCSARLVSDRRRPAGVS